MLDRGVSGRLRERRFFTFGFIQMDGIEHGVKFFEFLKVDFLDSKIRGGGYM